MLRREQQEKDAGRGEIYFNIHWRMYILQILNLRKGKNMEMFTFLQKWALYFTGFISLLIFNHFVNQSIFREHLTQEVKNFVKKSVVFFIFEKCFYLFAVKNLGRVWFWFYLWEPFYRCSRGQRPLSFCAWLREEHGQDDWDSGDGL